MKQVSKPSHYLLNYSKEVNLHSGTSTCIYCKYLLFLRWFFKVRKNICRLYRYVFPPHLKHGNLAIIGNIIPLGAVNPISEIQCRWATRLIKGRPMEQCWKIIIAEGSCWK